MTKLARLRLAFFMAAALILAACSNAQETPAASPTPTLASSTPSSTATPAPTSTPLPSPTPTFTPIPTSATPTRPTPTPAFSSTPSPIPATSVPPDRDLFSLAARLKIKDGRPIPRIVNPEPVSYRVGRVDTFKVVDILSRETSLVTATLHVATEHAYWYVDDRVSFDLNDLENSARQFEENIYPSIAGVFGPELSPGIDNDVHMTILNTPLRGVAGFYSGIDGYPIQVHPNSNQREMLYMNASTQNIGSDNYLGTLAHEFTHAVQFRADPSEDSWINEGLAEFGKQLAGYPATFLSSFIASPTVSLTDWPLSLGSTIPYYGAATHFIDYLAQQFGAGSLRTLMEEPSNGILGVEKYLAAIDADRTFQEVFADWLAASYLDDPNGGVYSFPETRVQTVAPLSLGIGNRIEDTLPQFAARYYELPISGQRITVAFRGQRKTPLLTAEPPSGTHCWWSNKGDSIDTTLTRQFDLPPDTSITLEYAIWHEIEEGWDFGYVEVSKDGGGTWDILQGKHTFKEDPQGNAFGNGHTGMSNGWLRESADLSPNAGRSVLLRFEYVTDDAIHGPGLCIDDISISGIAFFDDAESDTGAWEARGFVRAASKVPQAYVIRLIQVGERTVVSDIPIGADGTVSIDLGGPASEFEKAVLIIAAASGNTMQPASFELAVSQSS